MRARTPIHTYVFICTDTHERSHRCSTELLPLFPLAFFVPSDRRNQSSSERLNTLGWLPLLAETNSIERHESTKNVRRRDLKRAPDAFCAIRTYVHTYERADRTYVQDHESRTSHRKRNGTDKVDNFGSFRRYVASGRRLWDIFRGST